MPYQSIGAAAEGGLLGALQAEAEARQRDLINQARVAQEARADRAEARQLESDRADAEYKRGVLANDKEERLARAATVKATAREKEVSKFHETHSKGDFVGPEDPQFEMAKAEGLVAPENIAQGPVQPGQPPLESIAFRVSGTKSEQLRSRYREGLDPSSPEARAYDYEEATGRAMPAGALSPKPESVPLFRRTPKGTVENIATGQEVAELPQGGRIVNENAPPATPNPQPQIFKDEKTGAMRAIQFINGEAREVPLPTGLANRTTPGEAQSANRQDFAKRVVSHVPEIRDLVEQASDAGMLGPGSGRWSEFLAGKIGSTGNPDEDFLLGQLRTNISALKSGFAVVHGGARGGGSIEMAKRFDDLLSSGKMSKAELMGAISGFENWLNTYAKNPKAFDAPAEGAPPAASGGGPPAGATVIKYDAQGRRVQ